MIGWIALARVQTVLKASKERLTFLQHHSAIIAGCIGWIQPGCIGWIQPWAKGCINWIHRRKESLNHEKKSIQLYPPLLRASGTKILLDSLTDSQKPKTNTVVLASLPWKGTLSYLNPAKGRHTCLGYLLWKTLQYIQPRAYVESKENKTKKQPD